MGVAKAFSHEVSLGDLRLDLFALAQSPRGALRCVCVRTHNVRFSNFTPQKYNIYCFSLLFLTIEDKIGKN